MNVQKLKTETVKISLEIVKVCWIVHKNDLKKLKKIINLNHTYWGGINFIIIPVFNNRIDKSFKHILEIYDPDYIISFDKVNTELKKELNKVSTPLKIIENFKNKQQFYFLKDIYSLIDSSKKIKKVSKIKNESIPDSFKIFFDIIYPFNETKKILSSLRIEVNEVEKNIFEYLTNNSFKNVFSPLISSQPFWTSKSQFKSDSIKKIRNQFLKKDENMADLLLSLILGDSINIVLGDSSQVEDLSLYWNLRILYRDENLIWFPKSEVKNKELVNSFLKSSDIISKDKGSINDWQNLSIFSYSSTETEINQFKKILENSCKSLIKNKFSIIINDHETISYHGIKFSLKEYMYDIFFENGRGHIIPWHPDFLEGRNLNSLVTNISLHKLQLPKIKALLPLVIDDPPFINKNIESRLSSTGIRKILDNNMIYLKEPDSFEVIKNILKESDIDISISDKGYIANKLITLLGGLENCIILDDEEVINLIRNMVAKKDKQSLVKNLDEIKKYFKKNSEQQIEKLLKKKILFRGYNLKCKDCNSIDWISIDNLSEDICCSGCLNKLVLPLNPEMKYKLNSLVVYSFMQGALTHVKSLLSIKKFNFSLNFYIPGIMMKAPLNRELDLIIVDDEGLSIGECKNNATELKSQEYDSIKHIAEKINAKKVFFGSLFNEFSKSIKSKKDERVIFIDKRSSFKNKRRSFEISIT